MPPNLLLNFLFLKDKMDHFRQKGRSQIKDQDPEKSVESPVKNNHKDQESSKIHPQPKKYLSLKSNKFTKLMDC